MADEVEMDMDIILTSFSNLHFVGTAIPEDKKANWTHRGVSNEDDDDNDDDDDDKVPDQVKSVLNPAPSPVSNATPRWQFTRTPWAAGGFDYGIMTRSRTVVQNRETVSPRRQQTTSHLPRAFMMASDMLSIRDPWEEAAASKLPSHLWK